MRAPLSAGRRLSHILGERLAVAMSAHNPLSARLAEEAGFDAIWASGFEISASLGVPDASLVTMTQHLDMTRAIVDATSLPVVADLDTGFGNAINAAYAVRRYAGAGVAAVVIEDKMFPKMSSLAPGGRHELVRVEEFQGKIAAACEARGKSDVLIIARTETLVSGGGVDEAVARGAAYAAAGADLVLVHTKSPTPDELESCARSWRSRAGMVIVPTSCPQLDVKRAAALESVRMLIYGNIAIRAAVAGMKSALAAVAADGSALSVLDRIATVPEIFRLQRMDTHLAAEKAFLR